MKELKGIFKLKTRKEVENYINALRSDLERIVDYGQSIQIESIVLTDSIESDEVRTFEFEQGCQLASVVGHGVKSITFNFMP